MDDTAQQRESLRRAEKAAAILESPLWDEAWKLYEERLMQQFNDCKSDDIARLQQIKMLHLAGNAARKHLEALIVEGKFAVKNIEFQEKRSLRDRVVSILK